jgi:RNA polymerase primary sigma factor
MTKLLTASEEIELAKRIENGDTSARDELITRNERLVWKIANRYVGKLDFDELVQEGQIGLMTAVHKFDYRKGFRFSTYATHWIKQAMTRAIDNIGDMIRVPIHKKKTHKTYTVSLNAPLPGSDPADGLTYESMLEGETAVDLEDEYWQYQRAEKLMDILRNELTKRERQVLIMRFGLDRGGAHTLEEIGTELAMTREGVRQAEKRGLRKIADLV